MKDVETLAASPRNETGKRAARRMRADGRVPCVVYGHKEDPVSLTVNHYDLETLIRHNQRMLDLDVGGKTERVLITEIQHDTWNTEILHADFIRVAMDETIRLQVPIELKGHAKGEDEGGVREQQMTEVEVECLPGDIPESIIVSIAEMEVTDSLHVRDIEPPQGVTVVTDPDYLVVTIAQPTEVVEEETEAAEGLIEGAEEEPELIARGKEEAEEGAEEETGEEQ